MNQLTILLKNKTVLRSIVIAVLSVLQGYLFKYKLWKNFNLQSTQAQLNAITL